MNGRNSTAAIPIVKGSTAKNIQVLKLQSPVTLSSKYADLFMCVSTLQSALTTSPALINKPDENGDTLLHHAARLDTGDKSITQFVTILMQAPNANLATTNKNGDTALHVAVKHAITTNIREILLPAYLNKAVEQNISLNTLNANGHSILHMAINQIQVGGSCKTVALLLKCKNIDVNVLSTSGSSALFYAVHHMQIGLAEELMKKGADASLCNHDRNVMVELSRVIKDCGDATLKARWMNLELEISIQKTLAQTGMRLGINCAP